MYINTRTLETFPTLNHVFAALKVTVAGTPDSEWLAKYDIAPVRRGPVPDFDSAAHVLVDADIEKIGGSFISQYALREKTPEERLEDVHSLRRAEYPDIGDQLDAVMKWAFTETEISLPAELKSLAAKCMSVKSKYPKPEEE